MRHRISNITLAVCHLYHCHRCTVAMYLCNIDKCYYPGPRAGGASIVGSHTVANIKGILIDLSAAAARGGYCPPLWSVRADVSILSVITQLLMTTVEGGRRQEGLKCATVCR